VSRTACPFRATVIFPDREVQAGMINGDTLLGLIRTSTMLAVGDLVASTTFYRHVFGFQVVEQAHGPTLTRRDHVDA
jgi:hypothetical protein